MNLQFYLIIVLHLQFSLQKTPVRLAGGKTLFDGRLEVFYDGKWGTVCAANFDIDDAQVVCRMIGNKNPYPIIYPKSHFGAGSGPIWMDSLDCSGHEVDLAGCKFKGWGNVACGHNDEVGLNCDIMVRLVNGSSPTQGRLEVFHNNSWGTVCSSNFGQQDAMVVCKMLGFKDAFVEVHTNAYFGKGEGNVWMNNLACTGREIDISDCPFDGWGKTSCSHGQDVGISCSTSIRLLGGRIPSEGRVEVLHNGRWGSICDDFFSLPDAKVICKTLGFKNTHTEVFEKSHFGYGPPISMSGLRCHGLETDISRCKFYGWSNSTCNYVRETAGVSCGPPIRLIGGRSPFSGRLEVFHDNKWGSVCKRGFGKEEATVACRMLGFTNPSLEIYDTSVFGKGRDSILMSNVQCQGFENVLGDCSFDGWGVTDCTHEEDVGINCGSSARLADSGYPGAGRVEIMRGGQWGTICHSGFDVNAAKVVCRLLGFETPNPTVDKSMGYGKGSGVITASRIKCTGEESDISHCDIRWGGRCPTGTEAVAINCDDAVRLLNGDVESSGRVEVFHHGLWGTICDDDFDVNDAKVICRMLGYKSSNPSVYQNAYFGQGEGHIWMDGLQCNGLENRISDCRFKGWGYHGCDHNEDVGIACVTDVRLAEGGSPIEGRLEIFHNGEWGTVCNDYFAEVDAKVVCRMLGYFTNFPEVFSSSSKFGPGNSNATIFLDDVSCKGTETDIANCGHRGWAVHNCNHSQDVGLACSTGVRLLGGNSPSEGNVEIYHNGQWGGICPDLFNVQDGAVICRMLGYDDRHPRIYKNSHYGKGLANFLVDFYYCDGNEPDISFCMLAEWGVSFCHSKTPLGIHCRTKTRLQGGKVNSQGVVEVFHDVQWGTICGTNFGTTEAKVVCNSLGYNIRNPEIIQDITVDDGITHMWIENVTCLGREVDISSCSFNGWGNVNCSTGSSVAVSCETEIRLVGGSNPKEGTVEVRRNGRWSTICDRGFSRQEAIVACNMLGYYTAFPEVYVGSYFGSGTESQPIIQVNCTGHETDIADCFRGNQGYCSHWHDVGISCATKVRLAGGENPSEGRVEILHLGTWGSICNTSFTQTEAEVVCRMLGNDPRSVELVLGTEFKGSTFGNIWLDNLSCTGTEDDITLCTFPGWGVSGVNCSHKTDVGISCGSNIRLVGGAFKTEGRVEIYHGGEWGTICDDGFDENDARVICRMLGFDTTNVNAYGSSHYGAGSLRILLDDLQCNGNETHLSFCKFPGWGKHNCSHANDASVSCGSLLRLVDGSMFAEGRVEIYHDKHWGTICERGFDENEASVICRQLGFDGRSTTVYKGATYGEGKGPVFLSELDCNGTETDVGACDSSGWRNTTCNHNQDVGVRCVSRVRLVDGPKPSEGRVEIFHGGWGTICDDGFEEADGAVVCTLLGYNNSNPVIYTSSHYGQGSGKVLVDDLKCAGTEVDVATCKFPGWGVANCNHGEDIGIDCSTKVRLLDGSGPNEGRLEVYHNAKWGSVCSEKFDERDGEVICRMLGYKNPSVQVYSARFGRSLGPVWMSGLDCTGEELDIALCKFQGWGNHNNCSHDMDVNLSCGPKIQIRLQGGVLPSEGRVEVYNNSKWGTVCSNGFTREDATVLCRMLGFDVSTATPEILGNAFFGQGDGMVGLEHMNCKGSELDIATCDIQGWGRSNCSHKLDIGIRCPRTEARLAGGSVPSEGRLEVFSEGHWGTVCNEGFEENETTVFCRMMGFSESGGSLINRSSVHSETPNGAVLLSNLTCSGTENDVFSCVHFRWTPNACSHDRDVYLKCNPTEVRLVGGSGRWEGILEIKYEGVWGTVCDTGFGAAEAEVVCKMLGYKEGEFKAYSLGGSYFGTVGLPIFLDKLTCSGKEADIALCKTLDWGVHNCTHKHLAGVRCRSTIVRLVDGTHDMEGRVEILVNGAWNTICDDEWDDFDAQVICNQLVLYPFNSITKAKAFPGGMFGSGKGLVGFTKVKCSGSEMDVFNCSKSLGKVSLCDHSRDAGVSCSLSSNFVRLLSSTPGTAGTVEIFLNKTLGTLCGKGFDRLDAQVVCRDMGYWHNSPEVVSDAFYGEGTGSSWAVEPNCDGSEPTLAFCRTTLAWGRDRCDHSLDAGVKCIPSNIGIKGLRIVDGTHAGQGRLEVQYRGEWGAFCAKNWKLQNNIVVCKHLRYRTTSPVFYSTTNGPLPVYIGSLNCIGNETDVGQCKGSLDKTSCDQTVVGVDCSDGILARLRDGASNVEGRVEIFREGKWGSVCSSGFDTGEAKVICSMLGYRNTSPVIIYKSRDIASAGIAISNLRCGGWEDHISQCSSYTSGGTCGYDVAHMKCFECFRIFNTTNGNLTSPSYPSNYPANQDCLYIIQPKANSKIKIVINELSLNGGRDSLEVIDGENNGQLGFFSTNGILPVLVGKQFKIRFKSDSDGTSKGFSLSWSTLQLKDAVTVNCGRTQWDVSVNMTVLRGLYPNANVSDVFMSSCLGSVYDDSVTFSPSYTNCNTSRNLTVGDQTIYTNVIQYLRTSTKDKTLLWNISIQCTAYRSRRISAPILRTTVEDEDDVMVHGTSDDVNPLTSMMAVLDDQKSESAIKVVIDTSRVRHDRKLVVTSCSAVTRGEKMSKSLQLLSHGRPARDGVTEIVTGTNYVQFTASFDADTYDFIHCNVIMCDPKEDSNGCKQC